MLQPNTALANSDDTREAVVNFGYSYTEAQAQFRHEVTAWLDANLPSGLEASWELGVSGAGEWERWKAFRRQLEEKGWLDLTGPLRWGGSAAAPDLELVLFEELEKRGIGWFLNGGVSALRQALQEWGTEAQQQQILTPMAGGQVTIWYTLVELDTEPDPGDLGVQAREDGDDYVFDGEGLFVGLGPRPDYLWTLALLRPDERSHNASRYSSIEGVSEWATSFLVPMGLKGIAVTTPSQLAPGEAHRVRFDQVRVPRYCILGPQGEGPLLMESALRAEKVARPPTSPGPEVDSLLRYARETTRDGVPLSEEPSLQQLQMQVYIDSRITRLFNVRDAWMRATGVPLTYHSAQTRLLEQRATERLSEVVQQVAGIYALLDHRDPWAPAEGTFKLQQRRSLARQDLKSPAAGYEKVIARHLGLAWN